MQPEFFTRETARLGIAQLADATNATFAGYFTPVTHTPAGYAAFCRCNSVDMAQSVLLEHGDGRLAGLAMLATRGARGWCGGFGIVPEFRGRGLAATLIDALVGQARVLALTTLQLEVLSLNTKAIKAYARAGFETRRDLLILSGDIDPTTPAADPGLEVRPAGTPWRAWLDGIGLSAPAPCWQREAVSLLSMDVRGLVARRDSRVAGVLLYRPNPPSGPLALMHLAFDDESAGRALLARALSDTRLGQVFILNEPDDSPLHALLLSAGLRETGRQHEMALDL